MAKQSKFTKKELSWILYDVGNSAFTMLTCSLTSIWFNSLSQEAGIDSVVSHANYSYLSSVVTIIVAFIGPICGTIADNKGLKKPIFTTSLVIGVLGCVLMGVVNSWVGFAAVYIISKVAYNSSLVFYDSMITDVTTEDRMDVVSNQGFAWGYIGSCLPFLIALLFYMGGAGMIPLSIDPKLAKFVGCAVTAIWWFAVSVPLLKNYEQIYYVEPKKGAVKECFSRLGETLKDIVKNDEVVLFFLIAYFFYIDGVNTIINNAINIGSFLNLGDAECVIILLAIQVVACIFSLIFSRLSEKVDITVLLRICIIGYLVVAVYAMFLSSLFTFAILALMVAMFQGSIQALSRSYYGVIIPKERSGEYFGLYDIFSKGATFLGDFMLGTFTLILGDIRPAVATLSLFFLIGLVFFNKAIKIKKESNK